MIRWTRSLALTSILLLSACGGQSPIQPDATSGASSQPPASTPGAPPASTGPGASAGPDLTGTACELLSDADIAELTPFEVHAVEARSAGGIYENGCYWALAGDAATGSQGVQAEILLGVLAAGGREHFDTYLVPLAEGIGSEPLEGVGDVGLIGAGGNAVTIVDDDTLIDLQWIALSADTTAVPVALVERILENLAGD